MGLKEYLETKKINEEEIMKKYLNEELQDTPSKNEISKKLFYQEIATDEILAKYNEKGNFQAELIESIKPSFIEKLDKKLKEQEQNNADKRKNDTSLDGEEKQLDEKVEEKVSELNKEGTHVDEGKKREIKEKLETDRDENGEIDEEQVDKDIRAIVYEATLKEYHKLRQDLYYGHDGQIKSGSFAVGDRAGNKLLLYEKYLRKLDVNYRAKNGCFIGQDNEDVKEVENNLELRGAKAQNIVNTKANENMARINELKEAIEEIAENMAFMSQNAKNYDTQEFDKKMDSLQQQYTDKSIELDSISPSLKQMHDEITQAENLDRARDVSGVSYYDKIQDRKTGNARGVAIEKNSEKVEDKVRDSVHENYHDNVKTNLDVADALMNEFDEIVDKDAVKAAEILQSAKQLTNMENSDEDIKLSSKKGNHDEVDEKKSSNDDKFSAFSVQAECVRAVKSEDEILNIDVNELKSQAAQVRENISQKRSEYDKIR